MADKKKVISSSETRRRVQVQARSLVSRNYSSVKDDLSNKGTSNPIDFSGLSKVAPEAKVAKLTNKIILESSPTLERAMQILAGLITCPNGGSTVELSYDSDCPTVNENSRDAVLSVIRAHCKDVLKLHNTVYPMVYNIITTDGADAEMYIPSDIVGTLLDAEDGLESATKAYEELKLKNKRLSTKAGNLGDLTITTDLSTMLLKDTVLALNDAKVHAGIESAGKGKSLIDPKQILKRRHRLKKENTVFLSAMDKASLTHRMLIKSLPSEAVYPIHLNGVENEPYRYCILLDESGSPIVIDKDINFNDSVTGNDPDEQRKQLKLLGSELNMGSNNSRTRSSILDEMYVKFKESIMDEVAKSLLDGDYAEKFTVKQDDQIIDIAFQRFLSKKKTKILVVPPEQLSYITLSRDRYGVGESVVGKSVNIHLLHVVMFYAKFLENLDRSVPSKVLNLTVDENDLDQNKTLEMVVGEAIESATTDMDWNFKGPKSLMRNLNKSGIRVKVNQNSESGDLTNMEIDVEDGKRNLEGVDNDFLELLTKMAAQKSGISAELVDNSYSPDFSAQIVRDNDITARQITGNVTSINEGLSDRVVKRVLNDPILLAECLAAVKGGTEDVRMEAVSDVLISLQVCLPGNVANGLEGKLDNIDNLTDGLDKILDVILGDWITDGYPEGDFEPETLSSLRELTKSGIMREYIRKNSGINGLVDDISNGGKVADLIKSELEYKNEIAQAVLDNSKSLKRAGARLGKGLSKINEVEDDVVEEPVKDEVEEEPVKVDEADVEETTPPETEEVDGDVEDTLEALPETPEV